MKHPNRIIYDAIVIYYLQRRQLSAMEIKRTKTPRHRFHHLEKSPYLYSSTEQIAYNITQLVVALSKDNRTKRIKQIGSLLLGGWDAELPSLNALQLHTEEPRQIFANMHLCTVWKCFIHRIKLIMVKLVEKSGKTCFPLWGAYNNLAFMCVTKIACIRNVVFCRVSEGQMLLRNAKSQRIVGI